MIIQLFPCFLCMNFECRKRDQNREKLKKSEATKKPNTNLVKFYNHKKVLRIRCIHTNNVGKFAWFQLEVFIVSNRCLLWTNLYIFLSYIAIMHSSILYVLYREECTPLCILIIFINIDNHSLRIGANNSCTKICYRTKNDHYRLNTGPLSWLLILFEKLIQR